MDESHPRLQLGVEYPDRLSRFLIFVKWLLAIPHFIVLGLLAVAVGIVTFVAWFAILITGRYPEGLWRFTLGYYAWSNRVNAYVGLMRDEYPPFSFEGAYPAWLSLQYPTRLSRLMIFIKWLLIIPHTIVLYFVGIAASVVALIAWFAILFTGKYPEGLFRFYEGYMRWSNRANAYVMLLTDDYPPFTLDTEAVNQADIPPQYRSSQF